MLSRLTWKYSSSIVLWHSTFSGQQNVPVTADKVEIYLMVCEVTDARAKLIFFMSKLYIKLNVLFNLKTFPGIKTNLSL